MLKSKNIIESNCQIVVKDVQRTDASYSSLGNLFQAIKALMDRFHVCSSQFNYIQSKSLAYSPAKYVWHVNDVVLWYGKVPEYLFQTF